jgi:hypothetical protein
MRFDDYDDFRKRILTEISDGMRKYHLTYDQYGLMPESVGVIDASIVQRVMHLYALTPIVLEKSYEFFGIMPNRLSEAIAVGCLPIFVTDEPEQFKLRAKENYNATYSEILNDRRYTVTDNFPQMASNLLSEPEFVQELLSSLLSIANIDLAQFEKQIGAIIEHKAYGLTTEIYES